jgi:hypothetical protein
VLIVFMPGSKSVPLWIRAFILGLASLSLPPHCSACRLSGIGWRRQKPPPRTFSASIRRKHESATEAFSLLRALGKCAGGVGNGRYVHDQTDVQVLFLTCVETSRWWPLSHCMLIASAMLYTNNCVCKESFCPRVANYAHYSSDLEPSQN